MREADERKGVLRCLVHTFQGNGRPHVDITTPMCFDYGMKEGRTGHLSESWIVVIAASTNSS
jgi:hypothetical protein